MNDNVRSTQDDRTEKTQGQQSVKPEAKKIIKDSDLPQVGRF
jgi:hypothetical protein